MKKTYEELKNMIEPVEENVDELLNENLKLKKRIKELDLNHLDEVPCYGKYDMRTIIISPFALVDILQALNGRDIYQVFVSKQDNDMIVRWHVRDEHNVGNQSRGMDCKE